MKFQDLKESNDPQPEQDIVDKFAGVSDKLRSYYIGKWAEEKGIDSDDAMFMAGYVQDGYIGAGAWNWRYVGMDESVQEVAGDGGAPKLSDKEVEAAKKRVAATLAKRKEVEKNRQKSIKSGHNPKVKQLLHDEGTKIMQQWITNFHKEFPKVPKRRGPSDPLFSPADLVKSVVARGIEKTAEHFNRYGINRNGIDNEKTRANYDRVIVPASQEILLKLLPQIDIDKIKAAYNDPTILDMEEGSSPRADNEVDGADYSQDGMIGTPDGYYDAEQRQEAYRDLKDALDGAQNWQEDSIKDGICPECAGSGYMDGEYEDEDGNEGSECYGFGNYGCDEGEMTQNDDGLPNWAEIAKHDERQESKANRDPAPSKEQIMKLLPRLHDEYVKGGRYNAFELPSILRQMYPELNKRVAGSYVADFFKTFEESTQQIDEGDSDEVMVAKMLAKALGDPNRWTEMSAPELYAELESTNSEVADMISKVAKMLYDVKLEERAYKDVGVADTVKDQRGKEFNFDKGSKKFKSQDGEEADVTTKLGKDLMRIRKNQMKKTTPSYKTKKNQGIMASIEESYGEDHEITLEDNEDFNDVFGVLGYSLCEQDTFEAEYQGRKVKLNKPMQGDTKKFKVYVKDPKTGNVKKVNFGHGGSSVKGKAMKIRKSNPKARKSFRARHNCSNPGPKTKARYWSCRKW